MQFFHQKGHFSTPNLRFAYFVLSKMSIKGIIMFPGMNNTRLKRKIVIILDFENGFLPTYLPLCPVLPPSGWSRVYNQVFSLIYNLHCSTTWFSIGFATVADFLEINFLQIMQNCLKYYQGCLEIEINFDLSLIVTARRAH